MIVIAVVLAAGLNIEIDLGVLFKARRKPPAATCGIRVAGYRVAGRPGQQFGYGGETFTIPREGFVDVISLPRVIHVSFEGRTLPLDSADATLDDFGFRRIALPPSSIKGGAAHE